MPITAVIGAQWGDEGKGKIIDFLASSQQFAAGARFNGGNNAGHTVVANGKEYRLHHLPSTLVMGKKSFIGNGVVIDPDVLATEMESLRKNGNTVNEQNLFISRKAHVIMPYHKKLDQLKTKIGTTGRGIGPAYADKAAREGIRVEDLFSEGLGERMKAILAEKNAILKHVYQQPEFSEQEMLQTCARFRKILEPFAADACVQLNDLLSKGEHVLAEGAQAVMLDIDHGSYPYVTSSNSIAGGVCTGLGVSPRSIEKIIGVAKAYCSRVGSGPFPTEQNNEWGEEIRQAGKEFGTTTGRPRRIGYPDWQVLKYSAMVSGITGWAVTKLDVLAGKEFKVCTGHDEDGKPLYSDAKYSWDAVSRSDFSRIAAKGMQALPDGMRKYLADLEEFTKVPVVIASVGPEREMTVVKEA